MMKSRSAVPRIVKLRGFYFLEEGFPFGLGCVRDRLMNLMLVRFSWFDMSSILDCPDG